MNVNVGSLGWLAFLAATIIFVLLALGTITDAAFVDWGLALVAFGLAFGGWFTSRGTASPASPAPPA
jgi:hypothetical protein